jgi:hypothetical protein
VKTNGYCPFVLCGHMLVPCRSVTADGEFTSIVVLYFSDDILATNFDRLRFIVQIMNIENLICFIVRVMKAQMGVSTWFKNLVYLVLHEFHCYAIQL